MDTDQARKLLTREREDVTRLLAGTESAEADVADTDDPGDMADGARPLTDEGNQAAIADTLRDRLGALDRALARLDDGSYGKSVASGEPIPDARLEADPAAELTIEEAREQERARS